jgi:uncharacterized membrane protein YphA (DoxX/SURF4 family)
MDHPNPVTAPGPKRSLVGLFLQANVGQPSRATLVVRLAVGGVFFVSGVVKFLYENQGACRKS